MKRTETIQEWLVSRLAEALRVQPDEIDIQRPFSEFGLDSSEAVALSDQLSSWLGMKIEPTVAWYYPTIETLSMHLGQADELET